MPDEALLRGLLLLAGVSTPGVRPGEARGVRPGVMSGVGPLDGPPPTPPSPLAFGRWDAPCCSMRLGACGEIVLATLASLYVMMRRPPNGPLLFTSPPREPSERIAHAVSLDGWLYEVRSSSLNVFDWVDARSTTNEAAAEATGVARTMPATTDERSSSHTPREPTTTSLPAQRGRATVEHDGVGSMISPAPKKPMPRAEVRPDGQARKGPVGRPCLSCACPRQGN